MSSSILDLQSLNQAYTRLSEKFKTFWTFHQFLQGLHKTFFSDVPGYTVDFQGLYEQIKGVTNAMTFQPAASVLDMIHRFDTQLDAIHRTLCDDDSRISPNYVRRFFERVKTEDEKLLISILRFYFYARFAPHDMVDKMDFLITLVGARRSLDDGRYLPRFPVELQKLFGSFLALSPRNEAPKELVSELLEALARTKREIERCDRFEDLSEKKVLDNLRRIKHNMGSGFYTVECLSAMLEANLAAKNKFQTLYEAEERRIVESSRQLEEMERELERTGKFRGEDVEKEFNKFHQVQREVDAKNKERGVRRQEVRRLSASIETLLSRLDLPADLPPTPGPQPAPVETGHTSIVPSDPTPRPVTTETSRRLSARPAPAAPKEARVPGYRKGGSPSETDPLTAEYASKVLYSVELIDGPGSGGRNLSRLRLEPWEVRAARRILQKQAVGEAEQTRDQLFFESAVVRIRIDDEAQKLRTEDPGSPDFETRLRECGLCLVRAQELDRRFRIEIDAASRESQDKLKEVNRSRFRLLRSFSGLWLLHDTKSAG